MESKKNKPADSAKKVEEKTKKVGTTDKAEVINKKIDSTDKVEEIDNEEEDIITLTSEEGEQIDFYHEATIEFNKEWFVFLHPVEEMKEIGEDEVIIFKLVKGADGEDSLEPIEDENLLNNVYDEYVKIIDSYEDEEEKK